MYAREDASSSKDITLTNAELANCLKLIAGVAPDAELVAHSAIG
jgi:hypothetical protein